MGSGFRVHSYSLAAGNFPGTEYQATLSRPTEAKGEVSLGYSGAAGQAAALRQIHVSADGG